MINANSEFISVQEYLERELLDIEQGKGDFLNLHELDDHLEKTIQEYEN